MKRKTLLIGLLIGLVIGWVMPIFQRNLEDIFYAQISAPLEGIYFVEIPKRRPRPELEINSGLSVKINKWGRRKTFFRENSDEVLPGASLSKLMTAVIVLEDQNYDLENTRIAISEKAASQEDVPSYGNLKAGENFNVNGLLELMLIYSSNDAAWALSELIGTENFVAKMNQKAIGLGLESTHFINPTGLDLENSDCSLENLNCFNYSTAEDLVELTQFIMENHPLIFEISLREGPYLAQNGISIFSELGSFTLLGGKTGFTEAAGGCIILILGDEKENAFINVILGAQSPKARIEEMQKLIHWLKT